MEAEQVARNDAVFREANERIEEVARDLDHDDRVPFICECADPGCRKVVSMTLGEYERIRADSTHFLIAPNHDRVAPEHVEIVEKQPGYVVVAKIGAAAEVATELDARSP
jgi:hypothetical protein